MFRTTCGAYRAGEDGAFARTHVAPERSPSPFRLDVRADHVVLIEHRQVRWRSRRRFFSDASQLDSVALGRHALAFGFAHGRLWVSRLGGHEHAVGWSEGALTWTRRGDLLTVQRRHRAWQLAVRDQDGVHPHVIARRAPSYLVDAATQTVVYVTRSGSLVRSDGRSKQTVARLGSLGFDARATVQVLPLGLIGVSSSEGLAVLRSDGSVFAETTYPADPSGLTHGWPVFAVSADRVAVAVELDRPPPGGTAGEDFYPLRPGDTQAKPLAREQDDWLGCGWMVTMAWHRSWLLYSDSVVDVLAIDTDHATQLDLSAQVRRLPGIQLDETSGEYVGLDFAAWE